MKKMKRRLRFQKYFLLSWRKILIILIVWVTCFLVHNLIYALFGVEEAVFFSIAVIIIPLYLLISIVYTLFSKLKFSHKTQKNS